jgi:curved DNA-binding protein CbpA
MPREQWEINWLDYYDLLGVQPDSDTNAIREAYLYKIHLLHPDHLQGAPERVRHQAENELKAVNEAFEVLRNIALRRQYDEAWRRRQTDFSATSAGYGGTPGGAGYSSPEATKTESSTYVNEQQNKPASSTVFSWTMPRRNIVLIVSVAIMILIPFMFYRNLRFPTAPGFTPPAPGFDIPPPQEKGPEVDQELMDLLMEVEREHEAKATKPTSQPQPQPTTYTAPPTLTPAKILQPTATPDPIDRRDAGQVRYVANTDGMGVRMRSECSVDAQSLGVLPEGITVSIEYTRVNCDGWFMVRRLEMNEIGWVRADYLSSTFSTPRPVPITVASATTPRSTLTWDKLKNASYPSHWAKSKVANLVNGEYKEYGGQGKLSLWISLSEQFALGDLDGDNVDDAAVILYANGGGSGTWLYLTAVLNRDGVPVPVATQALGDNTNVQKITIDRGRIMMDMVVHKPTDPHCCPTRQQSQIWTLWNNYLTLQFSR